MTAVLARDALYYPRIHIRDSRWLKATLLAFPRVCRMAPSRFDFADDPDVRPFAEIEGPSGRPLLDSVTIGGPAVRHVQHELVEKLSAHLPELTRRYGRLPSQLEGRDSEYQVHEAKMIVELIGFLWDHGLAWDARGSAQRHRGSSWIAMHPRVGEAVMSAIAIAIANDKGFEIVTDLPAVHRALVTRDPADLIEPLLHRERIPPPARGATPDEVCQLAIGACFDVDRLSAQDIAGIVNDGHDLRRFKEMIVPITDAIPAIADSSERKRRLDIAAAEVISEWRRYRRSLPKTVAAALADGVALDIRDNFLSGFASGASSALLLGAEAGIAIGVAVYTGVGIVNEVRAQRRHPSRYLTRVSEHAPFIGIAGLRG